MHQMSDCKAKMHQIVCRLGLRPRLRWRAYSAPPYPLGDLLRRGGREMREGMGRKGREGGKGKGQGWPPKLKLGPRTIFLAPALWKSHIGLNISVN